MNSGTVHANAAGILSVACNSFDDDSTALWKISSSSSAVLRIDIDDTAQAPILDGDWTIADHGTLDVDSTGFDSNGSLTWTGGTIDVADGCVAAWF